MIKELLLKGGIYFTNISDGFDKYHHEVLTLSEEEAFDFVSELMETNGKDHSYADFYYGRLNEESKEKVKSILTKEEIQYINTMDFSNDEIIFNLDERLIRILVKLNAKEMLFSTFYFTKDPCTLWGNYNSEYVLFKNRDKKNLVP